MAQGMITVQTGTCMWCQKPSSLEMTEEQFARYERMRHTGGHIQDVLPEMSAGDREMLITGTHEACFDSIFGGEEDEDGEE